MKPRGMWLGLVALVAIVLGASALDSRLAGPALVKIEASYARN